MWKPGGFNHTYTWYATGTNKLDRSLSILSVLDISVHALIRCMRRVEGKESNKYPVEGRWCRRWTVFSALFPFCNASLHPTKLEEDDPTTDRGVQGVPILLLTWPVFRSRDQYWPIRGQYSGHVTRIRDQYYQEHHVRAGYLEPGGPGQTQLRGLQGGQDKQGPQHGLQWYDDH